MVPDRRTDHDDLVDGFGDDLEPALKPADDLDPAIEPPDGIESDRDPTDCPMGGVDDGTAADHRKGPRRRGGALTAAIFEATLAELAEVGYTERSRERVATRARASKGSLYRRWSNRAELVVDAMHHAHPRHIEAPDTGSVRADLLGYLRSIAGRLNGADGEAIRGLMVEAVRDPELMAVVRTRFINPGIDRALDILCRGAVRGEVRPTALTHRIASVGPSLLRQQFMVYGSPVPDEVLVELVDDVLMPLISPRNH
jgi:AcrR family transcriptional regulator